jgi:excinuclease ABC subunit A
MQDSVTEVRDARDRDGRTPRRKAIILRGVRQHNLKDVNLDIPRNALVVITGPSGSGKSSLAFDTIYAEGQRRYVESLSSYARQFLERMEKPDADLITGLAPAIAIEQRTTTRNPRSTVATQTEIYDHLRLFFARVGRTISPVSGEEVTRDSPRSVARALSKQLGDGTRFYLGFPVPERKKTSLKKELESLLQRGFFRLVVLPTERQIAAGDSPDVIDLNETPPTKANRYARERMLVLVDRLAIRHGDEATESRIADSVEQAFSEGGGRVIIGTLASSDRPMEMLHFSEHFERDGLVFEEPTPHLFSFNSPTGACPKCQGFGRVAGLDEDLIIPNPDLSIRQGALAPFRSEQWSEHFKAFVRVAAEKRIDIDMPYWRLPDDVKELIWEGSGEYVGIRGFFDFLSKRSYKMHYRIYHARFRGYTRCPACHGYRLRDAALHVKIGGRGNVDLLNIGEICEMTTLAAKEYFEALQLTGHETSIAGRVLDEIRKRLTYLVDVGLDYLSLDRLAQTLSGGESQRINLATSLGSALVGSLYVLDEPSIGLHPRDTDRLIRILEHLRDIGNTVLVVEHEAAMMRRADHIIDMGPGAGRLGGEVVAEGDFDSILANAASLTGAYLSGRKSIPIPSSRRPVDPERVLTVKNARQHNLKRITVGFPLGVLTCVTGVSGSGKSTLVHDTLSAGLQRLKGSGGNDVKVGAHDAILGHPLIDRVEVMDQAPIGKSPRSNPATYTNAFDGIRELFAATYQARVRGYTPGYFSFNVPGGRCEVCKGEGVVKIEMQFLSDLYLECEACKGRRYKQDLLDVHVDGRNIDDVLRMTVDEAVEFFADHASIVNRIQVLKDIGLGYLQLGQPSNTLSGGEAQRIKLASHLGKRSNEHVLYILDEPTTGLHVDDIGKLLGALNALVDEGNSVIVVEHNLDVIKAADHLIDMGPEGGVRGGFIVASGTPEDVADIDGSHTGFFLKQFFE